MIKPIPQPIPILVGATGTGKTAVGLEWARRAGGQIVSADSRQIYRLLRVGTAKPMGQWLDDSKYPLGGFYSVEGIPHHLMDFVEPVEPFNAGTFSTRATEVLHYLLQDSRPAMLVGGTGLYLRALVDGLAPLPGRNESLREELNRQAEEEGVVGFHRHLATVDPETARSVPPNNRLRIIRALEVFRLTGKPLSWWKKNETQPSSLPFRWFGIRWPKEILTEMLAQRCRQIIKEGLVEETETLLRKGISRMAPAFQALGYRLAMDRLDGKLDAPTFESAFIHETRLYTKRQMTWFRANARIHWFDISSPDSFPSIADRILSFSV